MRDPPLRDDFNATTDPDHAAAGFPQTCESCHTTVQWTGANFDHNNTNFPLTGAHTSVAQCQTCHVGGQFAGFGHGLRDLPLGRLQRNDGPGLRRHFPQTCESCHTTVQWTGANFDHNNTNFPLTGAHTSVAQCQTCHVGGQFAGLGTACATCHLDDFNATTDPDHAAGFLQTCESPHDGAVDRRKLRPQQHELPVDRGAHVGRAVPDLVTSAVSSRAGTACATCHLDDFNATTDPDHAAAGFPQTCESCHTTVQWTGANFDHNNTNFPS
ncbi:MAG: hypothetical protein R2748_16360 [Bryobacterales bacterium]